MRTIFHILALIITVPTAVAWYFHDMPTFIALALISAFVMVSSFFVGEHHA